MGLISGNTPIVRRDRDMIRPSRFAVSVHIFSFYGTSLHDTKIQADSPEPRLSGNRLICYEDRSIRLAYVLQKPDFRRGNAYFAKRFHVLSIGFRNQLFLRVSHRKFSIAFSFLCFTVCMPVQTGTCAQAFGRRRGATRYTLQTFPFSPGRLQVRY